MEPPLELRTLADARASPRVLYDLFLRQVAASRKYGYGTWMLARWTEDVWYGWGTTRDATALRLLLESEAPVYVVGTARGLKVSINTTGTHLVRAKAPSAPPAPISPPALPAMRSGRANTM